MNFKIAVAVVLLSITADSALGSACVPDRTKSLAEKYYNVNKHKAPGHGLNWFRTMVAFGMREESDWTATSARASPLTVMEAVEGEKQWRGWRPFRVALQCLHDQQDGDVDLETTEPTPIPIPEPAPTPTVVISGNGSVTEGEDVVFNLVATPAPKKNIAVGVDITNTRNVLAATQVRQHDVIVRTNGKGTLTIPTLDDSVADKAGSVIATVVWRSMYARPNAHNGGLAMVAVENNDVPPALPPLSESVAKCVSDELHENVSAYTLEGALHGAVHVKRWDRVLTAFGVLPGVSKMTVAEAQKYKDRGWRRWDPVVAALQCLDTNSQPEPPPSLGTIALEDTWTGEGFLAELWVTYTNNDPDNRCVDYQLHTHEGSAKLGVDFWEWTYADKDHTACADQGQTARFRHVIRTAIDSHDESWESFKVSLSIPAGRAIDITKGIATIGIVNDGPMPREYLARFGHAVAGNLVDAISQRMEANPAAGAEGTLGAVPMEGQTLGEKELLMGASGSATTETGAAVWGRISQSSFDETMADFRVYSDVTHFTGGTDVEYDDWLFGMALDLSMGDGAYSSADPGTRDNGVEADLTSIAPYVGYTKDRLKVWGALGLGAGSVELQSYENMDTPNNMKADTDWRFVATGFSHELKRWDRVQLSAFGDGFWQRIESDKTADFDSSDSESWRTRGGVRSDVDLEQVSLSPSAALRRDGGDVGNDTSIDIGLDAEYQNRNFSVGVGWSRAFGSNAHSETLTGTARWDTLWGSPRVAISDDSTSFGWGWKAKRSDTSYDVEAVPEYNSVKAGMRVGF